MIKRAHEWGWRSSRLTANEFAREAVVACDSLRGQWVNEDFGTKIIQDSPTVVETAFLNLQSEYYTFVA